ncbi:MAG: leucine-rich repeat protein, partial [Lachnospiraceae bacterium]|nr:leucine-rich repeat protein [Lachnospiraceae bacterium]
MDEQRAWIKMRRKRRLRVLAVVLCLSVLFVTYPNILETLSVFASENGSEENVLYVSGFCDLSDEIKEQTVLIGTGMEELALPDTLKAYMAQADEDSSVDIDKDADDREDEEADQGTEEQPGGEEASTEDQDASTEETDENVQETTEESGDTEQNTDTEKEEQDAQSEEIATSDTDAEIRQETHTVALQEYQAENEITVKRLEDSSKENTETDIIENRQSDDADIVTIIGITWQSDPAYDKETEDDYIFTAVLPEGYVLMEDVSMPQIVVTVKESENVRFFLERAEALPDLESMIEDAPGEDEKGYGEWETHFLESLSEAESLREMYDAFTETEQAQIPEDIYEKLAAWWEYADLMEEGTVYVSGTGWELNDSGVLTIESDAGMLDWRDNGRTTDNIGNVKQIVIKDGVTTINERAFMDCGNLINIGIPSSVTTMGMQAFMNCRSLTSIEIPSSVTSIWESVFENCSGLTSVTMPDSVSGIGKRGFYGCRSLTSIEIPSSLTSIGESVFENCSNLTSITIPNGVKKIGMMAFKSCSGLQNVTMSENLASISSSAFMYCSSLKEIEIPSTLKSISANTFNGCSSLTSIEIPSSVTSIQSTAFKGCSSLTKIEIPSSVTSIGISAFENCSSLTEIVISENVTSLGRYAFKGCSSLTEVTIPQKVTSINQGVFAGCSGLTSINIPSGVTSIGYTAFKGCSKLTEITIPEAVTSIGGSAFYNCSSLTEVTIPENVASIKSGAFSGCSGLIKVEMLSETPPATLGSNAFENCNFVTANKKGILVPVGKVEDYKGTAGWSSYADYITDGTPQVTEQPTDQTAQNGKTATFSITAEGEGTLEYQWQVDKKKGTFENIANATSSTYTISNVTKTYDGYKYRCKVTNDKGTVTSDEAVLTVTDSDAEIVAAAKKVVQDTLADITATNETTKESIQNAIDAALANAGMTEVTVEVGGLTKTEATSSASGSIGGSISITSKNDSSVKASVTISKTIAKLPLSEEEKVAAAKKVVQEALTGITATNDTTKESIQNAIDTALAEASIADVTVKVENLTKTEATTDKTGSISGSISITSKRDSSVKASVSINKTIPATGEEEPDKDKPSGSGSGTSKPHRPKPTDTPQQTDTPNQTDTQRPTDTPLETPAQTQQTVPLVSGTANSLDGQPVTPQMQPQGIPGQGAGQENTAMVRQGDTDSAGTETEQPPTNGTVQTDTAQTDATQQSQGRTVSAAADDGRIVISGEPVATGNLTEELETTTKLEVGKGAVVVTVVCEDKYTAGVTDTVSMVNAVLAPE